MANSPGTRVINGGVIYGKLDTPIQDQALECFRSEDFSFQWFSSDYDDVTSYELTLAVSATQGGTALFTLSVGSGISFVGGSTPWLADMEFTAAQLALTAGTYYFTVAKQNPGAERVLSTGIVVVGKGAT